MSRCIKIGAIVACIYAVKALQKKYKGHNGCLGDLTNSPPDFFWAESSIPLGNQNFAEVDQKSILEKLLLHDHLLERYKNLSRVKLPQKIHHSHFISLSLDYGHQRLLDNLQNQKHIVLQALERLNRRAAEVSSQSKVYSWLHKSQDDEEEQRDKEVKKVKREAALFERHQKEIELLTHVLRPKGNEHI